MVKPRPGEEVSKKRKGMDADAVNSDVDPNAFKRAKMVFSQGSVDSIGQFDCRASKIRALRGEPLAEKAKALKPNRLTKHLCK